MNIIVAVTGSVATIKLPEVVNSLKDHFPNASIKVVATKAALHFIRNWANSDIPLLTDETEWECWTQRGDPILHIEVPTRLDIARLTI
jgi:phosphopantothenoylcysteine decarboxylase